jgi:hypothetical protein
MRRLHPESGTGNTLGLPASTIVVTVTAWFPELNLGNKISMKTNNPRLSARMQCLTACNSFAGALKKTSKSELTATDKH